MLNILYRFYYLRSSEDRIAAEQSHQNILTTENTEGAEFFRGQKAKSLCASCLFFNKPRRSSDEKACYFV